MLFFDLEDPTDLDRLENPMLALSKPSYDFIVINEIQRRPELFPVLRVLVDKMQGTQKILILGSASRDLILQSLETLAGRIGYIEVMPFSLDEVGKLPSLWLRGGYPKAFLAASDEESFLWRKSYITTFLERDISSLGFQIPPQQMRRFWLMLAHYHGQIFNASELGRLGAELDLLILKDGKRLGFEFKYTESPKITKSMHISLNDLELDHLYFIYPGEHEFPLSENISARGIYTNKLKK